MYRPNGELRSLALPDKPYVLVRYPTGDPSASQYISPVTSKEEVYRKLFHYYIAKPVKNGKGAEDVHSP